MTSPNLPKLATAITYLAANYLAPGQRLTIDRIGRSVTWDSTIDTLPRRVRGGAETPEERAEFARCVFTDHRYVNTLAAPRTELAEGLLALRPGQRLHVSRFDAGYEFVLEVPGHESKVITIMQLDELGSVAVERRLFHLCKAIAETGAVS